MSRVYKLANSEQTSVSTAESSAEKETDWNKCFLCQKLTGELLQSPASSKRSTDGAGYKTLADKLLAFKKINCLPLGILSRLTTYDNLEKALGGHEANWHDSCRLQYNKTKLERAEKRQASLSECADAPTLKKNTRSSSVSRVDETEF